MAAGMSMAAADGAVEGVGGWEESVGGEGGDGNERVDEGSDGDDEDDDKEGTEGKEILWAEGVLFRD